MEKTEITKLVVQIDGKEVSIDIETAKTLYAALKELFGKENTIFIPPVIYRDRPYQYWQPYYSTTGRHKEEVPGTIYCTAGTQVS
jgi:hypothetical protein